MSTYSGAVTSGSVCAVMQSTGATGLGVVSSATLSLIGARVGQETKKLYSWTVSAWEKVYGFFRGE